MARRYLKFAGPSWLAELEFILIGIFGRRLIRAERSRPPREEVVEIQERTRRRAGPALRSCRTSTHLFVRDDCCGVQDVTLRSALLPMWAALPLALISGIALDAGFPDRGVWPLAFVGVGIVLAVLIGRTAGGALLIGFAAGVSFYLAHIQWASLFLGPLPMTALVVLQALLFALGCVLITLAYRWIPLARPAFRLLLPVAVAGLWTLREVVASTWPYGGFSWGRLAMSQSDSPLKELFSWVGISGVSFLMVLAVALVVDALHRAALPPVRRAIAPVLVATIMVALPAWPVQAVGTMRVAAIQGNGPAGYFDERGPGELLAAQYDATLPVLGQDLDVVLWPEGSTDHSPLEDANTAKVFDRISTEADAPLVGWAVTERDGLTYNTQILWNAGDGAVDFYDKKHPVPFGEYVPDRAFWRPFAPELIDLVQRDYTPGIADPIFDIAGVPVGVNICFDIADDQVLRESALQGAQVIFAASNNADFGRTDQSAQQLTIARVRALELGRTVVNVSTVGLTAIIGPDGRVLRQLPWHTPGSIVDDIDLVETLTPATLIGQTLEWLLTGIGMGILIASISWRRPSATAASAADGARTRGH